MSTPDVTTAATTPTSTGPAAGAPTRARSRSATVPVPASVPSTPTVVTCSARYATPTTTSATPVAAGIVRRGSRKSAETCVPTSHPANAHTNRLTAEPTPDHPSLRNGVKRSALAAGAAAATTTKTAASRSVVRPSWTAPATRTPSATASAGTTTSATATTGTTSRSAPTTATTYSAPSTATTGTPAHTPRKNQYPVARAAVGPSAARTALATRPGPGAVRRARRTSPRAARSPRGRARRRARTRPATRVARPGRARTPVPRTLATYSALPRARPSVPAGVGAGARSSGLVGRSRPEREAAPRVGAGGAVVRRSSVHPPTLATTAGPDEWQSRHAGTRSCHPAHDGRLRPHWTMRIGIPTEVKNHEDRVALTPAGAHHLVRAGHDVLVQSGAGTGSHLPDAEFESAGRASCRPPRRSGARRSSSARSRSRSRASTASCATTCCSSPTSTSPPTRRARAPCSTPAPPPSPTRPPRPRTAPSRSWRP